MPVAVVTKGSERFDLRTLEGAYVVIRQMTYGEKLTRQGMSAKMKISGDKNAEHVGEIEMAMRQLAIWDFQHLILDHNLEDQHGQKLNFKNVAHIEQLRGDVGDEVGKYIDSMNSFEDLEEGN